MTGSSRHEMVFLPDKSVTTGSLPWNPHPKYSGVSLRHLATGSDTGGRMSLHHVRIDPGCSIGEHAHNNQVETHDVLEGTGTCTLEGKKIAYAPGALGVMPADRVHRVDAGEGGILLLATFSPPLV